MLDAFAQAAQQAGIPATEDFNRGNNEGVSYFEVNQKAGWRWNTAKAFLRPTCYARPNFELWNKAQVAKLPLPDLVAQKDWAKARLDKYLKSVKAHVEAADKLQKAAHTAFDQGKY